jgi:hypothetical protein
VRQRANGTWEARLTYVDPATGHRRSVSLYAPTAEAVRNTLDEARDRIKEQAPVRDSSQRLADRIEYWSDTLRLTELMTLSPSAIAAIIPYSTALWSIFTKCPAPLGAAVQIPGRQRCRRAGSGWAWARRLAAPARHRRDVRGGAAAQ